jgi:hypothetical protein
MTVAAMSPRQFDDLGATMIAPRQFTPARQITLSRLKWIPFTV